MEDKKTLDLVVCPEGHVNSGSFAAVYVPLPDDDERVPRGSSVDCPDCREVYSSQDVTHLSFPEGRYKD